MSSSGASPLQRLRTLLEGKKTYILDAVQLIHAVHSGGILSDPILEVLQSSNFQEGAILAGEISTIRAAIARVLKPRLRAG